jgi:hypothetical protein
MKNICMLISLLMLFAFASACGIGARRICNYQYPQANYQQDDYQCQMLAEAKRANTGHPEKYPSSLWYTDCMYARGWQTCRE